MDHRIPSICPFHQYLSQHMPDMPGEKNYVSSFQVQFYNIRRVLLALIPAWKCHNMEAKQRRSKMPHRESNPRLTNPPSAPVVHSPLDKSVDSETWIMVNSLPVHQPPWDVCPAIGISYTWPDVKGFSI